MAGSAGLIGEALRAARFATAAPAHIHSSLRSLPYANIKLNNGGSALWASLLLSSLFAPIWGKIICGLQGYSLRGHGLRGQVPTSCQSYLGTQSCFREVLGDS